MCHSKKIEILRYKIIDTKDDNEVMYHEKLLGFSIPITRDIAERYNTAIVDTENWFNSNKMMKNEPISYAKKILDEVCLIAKEKKITVENDRDF